MLSKFQFLAWFWFWLKLRISALVVAIFRFCSHVVFERKPRLAVIRRKLPVTDYSQL